MNIEELKILPIYFEEVVNGNKTFELRKNDRDYKVGLKLVLREFENNTFTGRIITKTVTYILKGGQYGLDKDYVILGIK